MDFISRIFFISIIAMLVTSCGINNLENDNFQQIHEEFHGQYKPISSYSNHPIDLNMDGHPSSDMLEEYYNLEHAYLRILIIDDPSDRSENTYLFSQPWPNQVFPDNTQPGDSDFYVNYAAQGTIRSFSFSPRRDSLIIHQDTNSDFDSNKFPVPGSVVVENNHQLEVVIQKRLYTASGWQTVKITTHYTRFTTET